MLFQSSQTVKLLRRVNVLIYLNDDWSEKLEVTLSCGTRACRRRFKVSPLMNRCVVFSTTETSYFDHPEPLNCPEDRSRRSIALYYYTSSPSILQSTKSAQQILNETRVRG